MNEPKLRFKEDDGSQFPDWEKKKISDIFSKVKDKNKDGQNQNVITNSAEFGLINQRDFFDKDIAVDGKTENYTVIKTGDFVYNPRKSKQAPYGPFNCYHLEEDGIVSPLYTCLRPNGNADDKYLHWYFQSGSWYRFIYENGAQNGARHDRVGMTDSLMQEIPVYLPQALPEQQKIAEFLSTIDTVITKQKETVSAWEERKKGVMQKLFSQEVRFKADDGSDFPEWEEKKLGECGRFYTGVGFSEKYQGHKGLDVDVYKVSDMNIIGNEKYMTLSNNTVDDLIVEQMKTKVITSKCLVFAKVGAAIYGERKRITTKPFLIDNNMMAFEPCSCLNIEYLHSWSCSVKFSQYAQVGALPSYNSSDIGIIKIHIPCLAEQQKIADCLSSLDEVIKKQKATLAAWEELKKGLLQQMFV